MRVWIHNNFKDLSRSVAQQLNQKLSAAGVIITSQKPDLVITVGGDGTFLSTFHQFSDQLQNLRFVGIHTGHLGFYTDWQDSEIDELVNGILSGQQTTIDFPLLSVKITYANGQQKKLLSLNESQLKRVFQTMRADILIDGQFFERFRGDGISVSTPTGSTAYAKSIGGAIIDPTLEVMQFNEVAPINNRVYRTVNSPLILPKGQLVTVVPQTASDYVMTADNLAYDKNKIVKAEYQIAAEKIHLANFRPKNFWQRVRGAFLTDGTR
ncbi:NAD kinase [Bombilactobacillus folatiphilus]|uniref:NAD kinase n=1 Tax=Bombilactobacillus folatiphilus TaxID=2923362 RepID=A0ABY4P819_9LACO|nr:NAD kinase [Bombilactobacillus folatiphilus]UQS81730.1 NAD kinase [Bombilactobacillus folatiphilus]